jgi:hypothetical protein
LIRGNKVCKNVIRFDANALYLWDIMQDMIPVGKYKHITEYNINNLIHDVLNIFLKIDKHKDIVNTKKIINVNIIVAIKRCDIITIPTYKDFLIIANDIVEHAKCWDHHFFEAS